ERQDCSWPWMCSPRTMAGPLLDPERVPELPRSTRRLWPDTCPKRPRVRGPSCLTHAPPASPAPGVPRGGTRRALGQAVVQVLQQFVGGQLDLLVPPLGGPVHARDDAHPVDPAEIP